MLNNNLFRGGKMKIDLYEKLRNYDYNLYIKTIEKSENLCCALNLDIKQGAKVESCMIEFALQCRHQF